MAVMPGRACGARPHFQASYRHLMPVSIPLALRLAEAVAEWTPWSSHGVTDLRGWGCGGQGCGKR